MEDTLVDMRAAEPYRAPMDELRRMLGLDNCETDEQVASAAIEVIADLQQQVSDLRRSRSHLLHGGRYGADEGNMAFEKN